MASQFLQGLIELAVKINASDIHLHSHSRPALRVNGKIEYVAEKPLLPADIDQMVDSLIADERLKKFQETKELDYGCRIAGQRLRASFFFNYAGPCIVFRLIKAKIITSSEIGIPQDSLRRILDVKEGMIIVTGPTGSGKSTTIASFIDYWSKTSQSHIITIEDPVEYLFESSVSLINQREVGINTMSFYNASLSALREDPDIIMIGELREQETAKVAMMAAQTGHLVITTLHAFSASGAVDRMTSFFDSTKKDSVLLSLAHSLKAVIAQRMAFSTPLQRNVAIFEILIVNDAMRELISNGRVSQINSMMQIGASQGMCIMQQSIERMIKDKTLTKEDAII